MLIADEREYVLEELLYADELTLMSETIEIFWNKLRKWKDVFERICLKDSLGKTKVMVIGYITKDGMSKGKGDPCWVSSLRVKAQSVLCEQYGKWIHGRCAGGKSFHEM